MMFLISQTDAEECPTKTKKRKTETDAFFSYTELPLPERIFMDKCIAAPVYVEKSGQLYQMLPVNWPESTIFVRDSEVMPFPEMTLIQENPLDLSKRNDILECIEIRETNARVLPLTQKPNRTVDFAVLQDPPREKRILHTSDLPPELLQLFKNIKQNFSTQERPLLFNHVTRDHTVCKEVQTLRGREQIKRLDLILKEEQAVESHVPANQLSDVNDGGESSCQERSDDPDNAATKEATLTAAETLLTLAKGSCSTIKQAPRHDEISSDPSLAKAASSVSMESLIPQQCDSPLPQGAQNKKKCQTRKPSARKTDEIPKEPPWNSESSMKPQVSSQLPDFVALKVNSFPQTKKQASVSTLESLKVMLHSKKKK